MSMAEESGASVDRLGPKVVVHASGGVAIRAICCRTAVEAMEERTESTEHVFPCRLFKMSAFLKGAGRQISARGREQIFS